MRMFLAFLVLLLVGVSSSKATNGVPFRVRFAAAPIYVQPAPVVIQQDVGVGVGYYTAPLNLGVGYSGLGFGIRSLQNRFFFRNDFRSFQQFRFRGR